MYHSVNRVIASKKIMGGFLSREQMQLCTLSWQLSTNSKLFRKFPYNHLFMIHILSMNIYSKCSRNSGAYASELRENAE